MNVEEIKHELKKIFGEQIHFNKEFDDYAKTIKNIEVNLVEWCQAVKDEAYNPIPTKRSDIIIFIKKIGSSNRCIVLKIMNGKFKELHLGDHDYYDRLRQQLGIKRGSH